MRALNIVYVNVHAIRTPGVGYSLKPLASSSKCTDACDQHMLGIKSLLFSPNENVP